MSVQGDLDLLADPVAQRLLAAASPARLAYSWTDGSPRVVPTWFHWTGQEVVLGTPPRAPKLVALRADPRVALTIDSEAYPYKVLSIRGRATVELQQDVVPEYEAAAVRYFGPEAGHGWADQLRGRPMARVAIEPLWVAVLDFETRFPSALSV